MGYVTANLAPGERVVHKTHLHWKIFIWPAMLLIGGLITLSAGRDGENIGGVLLVVAVPFAIKSAIHLQTAEFAVTQRRIIMKWGVISRRSFDLRLSHLETINVQQGVLGRLFDWGRVEVIGSGGTRAITPNVADPLGFRLHAQSESGQFQSHTPIPARPVYEQERECPHCAEIISAKAKVCKSCGRDVDPLIHSREENRKSVPTGHNMSDAEVQTRNEFRWTCPNCRTSNAPNFTHCYNCGQKKEVPKPVGASDSSAAEEAFFTILELEGLEKAKAMYEHVRQTRNEVLFRQSRLDEYATETLRNGKIDLAIDLFKWNVEAYPDNSPCYSSLAEGYKARGDLKEAISLYRKSLEVLVSDRNGTEESRKVLLLVVKTRLAELIAKTTKHDCPACGKSNDLTSKYCIFCGASLPPASN